MLPALPAGAHPALLPGLQGGGIVHLTAHALAQGSTLPAIDLTERGEVTRIEIHAFAAGRVVPTVAERLAAAAEKGEGQGGTWLGGPVLEGCPFGLAFLRCSPPCPPLHLLSPSSWLADL